MKKDEFEKNLRKRIEIFTEEEQKNIIKYYKDKIETSNLLEEKAIEELGSIEQITNEIYLNHGIDPLKIKKKKIRTKLEELFQLIHDIIEKMSHNTLKENSKIILDFFVLIFFICLIKLPFIFVRNMGEILINPLEIPIMNTIWGVLIDIIYIIVAIFVFINIFTKWFGSLKEKQENKLTNTKGKSLEAITLDEKNNQ